MLSAFRCSRFSLSDEADVVIQAIVIAVSIKHTEYKLILILAHRVGSDSENSDHYPDFQIILI